MRKIEEKMVAAFRDGRNFRKSNTMVLTTSYFGHPTTRVYLFNNCIATRDINGCESFSTAGYRTATTLSRLRALGLNLTMRKGILYRDGKAWESDF